MYGRYNLLKRNKLIHIRRYTKVCDFSTKITTFKLLYLLYFAVVDISFR